MSTLAQSDVDLEQAAHDLFDDGDYAVTAFTWTPTALDPHPDNTVFVWVDGLGVGHHLDAETAERFGRALQRGAQLVRSQARG